MNLEDRIFVAQVQLQEPLFSFLSSHLAQLHSENNPDVAETTRCLSPQQMDASILLCYCRLTAGSDVFVQSIWHIPFLPRSPRPIGWTWTSCWAFISFTENWGPSYFLASTSSELGDRSSWPVITYVFLPWTQCWCKSIPHLHCLLIYQNLNFPFYLFGASPIYLVHFT